MIIQAKAVGRAERPLERSRKVCAQFCLKSAGTCACPLEGGEESQRAIASHLLVTLAMNLRTIFCWGFLLVSFSFLWNGKRRSLETSATDSALTFATVVSRESFRAERSLASIRFVFLEMILGLFETMTYDNSASQRLLGPFVSRSDNSPSRLAMRCHCGQR